MANSSLLFVRISLDYGCKKTEKSLSLTDSNVQTFLEGEENQNVKRKNESYVFSGFGNNGKMVTKRVAV